MNAQSTNLHAENGTEGLPAWVRSLINFWFEPADPTLVGLIRICTGVVTLYICIAYSFGLMAYVGPDGWVDHQTAHFFLSDVEINSPPTSWMDLRWNVIDTGNPMWSIYFHVTDPRWIWAIHFGILAAMFLFTIGCWTRVTAVLSWLGSLGYMQRGSMTLFGMDTMDNILLMYLALGAVFGATGGALSVDRWLEVRRQRRFGVVSPPSPNPWARVVLRLIQVHFCYIYLASGLSKLQGSTWWNGTALWGTYANAVFAPMYFPPYVWFLRFLSRHRIIWEVVMGGGGYFTLFLEISLPFLIWRPRLRWLFVIGSILLHTGIALTMGLTGFSLLMMTLVIAFAPPEVVRPLLVGWFGRKKPQLAETASLPVPPPKSPVLATAGGR